MNPTPVPAPTASDSGSADPGRRRFSFSAATAVAGIIGVVLVGAFLSRVFERLNAQGELTAETRQQATQISEAFERFRSETTQVTRSLPQSQKELEGRVVELEQVISAASEQLALLRQEAGQRQLDNARARAWVTDLHNEGNRVREELRELETGAAAWEVRRTALMENDEGKRIAASPAFLELFATILASPPPKPQEIAAWKDRLDILLSDIDRAHRQPEVGLAINEELGDDVRQLAREVRRAKDSFQQQQAAIGAILREVARQMVSAGDPGLAQALERRSERLALEAETQGAEAARRVREEYLSKVAEARAETERVFGETALEKERLTQAGAKLLAEVETRMKTEQLEDVKREEAERLALREQALAKADLERRFAAEYPRMKESLLPFTSDGFMQPQGGQYKRTAEKGPVSFSKMQASGMLDNSVNALQKLNPVALGATNDRPMGAFPQYRRGIEGWDNQKQEATQRVQKFLIDYGELMVEKGLLAP